MAGRFRAKTQELLLGIILGLICSSITWAQGGQDVSQLVAKVDPSVVLISIKNESLGSGFVIDESGTIVTNYHVIEGAKTAIVTFPANKEKKLYRVSGFLAIQPGKDLALIRISAGDNTFPALKLAETAPAKGERVFAFGSPLGLSGSVSDGMVSALRSGREVREIFLNMAHKDVYKDIMDYDIDAEWLQITAPISPGNSGGPLVNAQGEVVGVNTWVFGGSMGQNLNFSISVANLRQMVSAAGTNLQSLSNLPPPRENRGLFGDIRGNLENTLSMWKQYNELKNELNAKMEAFENRLLKITPIDPNNVNKGLTTRLKRCSEIYKQMANTCYDYASRLKALNNVEVDSDLIGFAVMDAELGQRFGDVYKQFSYATTLQSNSDTFWAEVKLERVKEAATEMRTAHDILRLKLSNKYNTKFPTLKETKNSDSKSENINPEKQDSIGDLKESISTENKGTSAAGDSGNRSVVRTWTDRSGQHQVQAKFLGIEDGKVKLEKTDGKVILVPIQSLSEADRRFIGVAE